MWLRLPDTFDTDPVILNVCRTNSDVTRVVGWITRLMLYCASGPTDGYVPEIKFREIVRSPRWREQLTNPGRGTALVHRRGDECECLPNGWPQHLNAADYYVHHYLQSNPTREETDVARAKQAELRDRELQAHVRARDLNRCRYCACKVVWADRRSSMGGVFDHVDPAVAAGAGNLVVACRGCNSRKGHRTPAAAGMTLLPVPTDPRDQTRDQAGDQTRTNWSAADTTTHAPVRDGTGRVTPPVPTPNGSRAAQAAVGPPAIVRTSRHPNPHLRSAITGPNPLDHAGLPSPADIDNALDHHDAFMPEGGT